MKVSGTGHRDAGPEFIPIFRPPSLSFSFLRQAGIIGA
jgi:hypothetical protein